MKRSPVIVAFVIRSKFLKSILKNKHGRNPVCIILWIDNYYCSLLCRWRELTVKYHGWTFRWKPTGWAAKPSPARGCPCRCPLQGPPSARCQRWTWPPSGCNRLPQPEKSLWTAWDASSTATGTSRSMMQLENVSLVSYYTFGLLFCCWWGEFFCCSVSTLASSKSRRLKELVLDSVGKIQTMWIKVLFDFLSFWL